MEERAVREAVGKRAQNCKAKMGDLVTENGKINNDVGNIEDKQRLHEEKEKDEGRLAERTVKQNKINEKKETMEIKARNGKKNLQWEGGNREGECNTLVIHYSLCTALLKRVADMYLLIKRT